MNGGGEMNYKKYIWDGSYTLEAAFVMPVILGIIFAWMFQLFYLHDQLVISGYNIKMLVKCREGATAFEELTETERMEAVQRELWVLQLTHMNQKEGLLMEKSVVQGNAGWDISILRWFLKNGYNYKNTAKLYNTKPETWVRLNAEKNRDDGKE